MGLGVLLEESVEPWLTLDVDQLIQGHRSEEFGPVDLASMVDGCQKRRVCASVVTEIGKAINTGAATQDEVECV